MAPTGPQFGRAQGHFRGPQGPQFRNGLVGPLQRPYREFGTAQGHFGDEVGSFRVQDPDKSYQFGFSNKFLLGVIICLDLFSLL